MARGIRAQEPGFAHCIGHAKPGDTFATWLSGEAAKRARYAWAGIPNQLVAQWAASQRRRQARRAAKGQRNGDNDAAEHPLIKSQRQVEQNQRLTCLVPTFAGICRQFPQLCVRDQGKVAAIDYAIWHKGMTVVAAK